MDAIINYFLQPQNGIQGVIIVVLGYVIWRQQGRLDRKDESINDLQNKRKADTDAYTASYTELSREQISASKDTTAAIGILQRSIDSLATAFQAFLNKN